MKKLLLSLPCLFLLLCPGIRSQSKAIRLRGTVEDAVTRKPVGGATVYASGDTGQQNEITDDNGFFRLVIEGVAAGDLVRIRVVKDGYSVYDRQVVTSEEIPITIDLRRSGSAGAPKGTSAPAAPHKAALSNDPVTARYIEEMTTQTNPTVRLNALKVIAESAAKDPAALAAVAAATKDGDYRVREFAAFDLGNIGKDTPQVITALRIALDDPEPEVHIYAIAALGSFPKDKVAVDALFRVLGTPPNGNTYAAMALHNEGLDDPRITAVLIHAATVGRDGNAAAALGQLHQSPSSVNALFASLGTPPNTNPRTMNILTSMNIDDPRLMAAYIDQAHQGNSDAILALGKYPQRKEAISALFDALGTPPQINLTAMKVLSDLKIDDPRLVEAWIATANTYNSASAAALLRKAPFSPDIIARLLTHLQDSLHRPQNWVTQIDLGLLLQGGEGAHQALHTYLASADTGAQTLVAVAWLETDHSAAAKAEILQTVRVADVRAAMLRVMKLSAKGYVSVPGYPSMTDECFNGLSLRLATGLLVLGLAPPGQGPRGTHADDQPLSLLTKSIDDNVVPVCATYSVVALSWMGSDILNQPAVQAAMPALLDDLLGCAADASPDATFETFAQVGNLDTLARIRAALNGQSTCSLNAIQPILTQKRLDELTARIRTRLNAR